MRSRLCVALGILAMGFAACSPADSEDAEGTDPGLAGASGDGGSGAATGGSAGASSGGSSGSASGGAAGDDGTSGGGAAGDDGTSGGGTSGGGTSGGGTSGGAAGGSSGSGGGPGGGGSGGKLLWTGDFETGDIETQFKLHLYKPNGHAALVTSPTRAGKYASALWIDDAPNDGSNRAELIGLLGKAGDAAKAAFTWDDGVEYWIGLSFMLDKWTMDTPGYTFFQIHAPNEVKGAPCDYAGNAIGLYPSTTKGMRLLVIQDGGVSEGKGAGSNTDTVWTGPYLSDQWQDWVFHFTLSTKGKGFFRVWRNGDKIYDKGGLTNVNHIDSCGEPIPADKRKHNGPHIGIYASSTPHFRKMFYDELRLATGTDAYNLVAP